VKAVITSIGELTTEVCKWSLERNGFETILIQDKNTLLAEKLEQIYKEIDEDFVRVDADVVPNNVLTPELMSNFSNGFWWYQFLTFDWFKQETTHGGIQLVKKEAIPILRANISRFKNAERPESQMYRLEEFHKPRRCKTINAIMGLHNYKNDIERVKEVKKRRGQSNYDWELAERLNSL
jgi:hypothetical protein